MDANVLGRLKFFRAQHVSKTSGRIEIDETDPNGAGKAIFIVSGDAIKIRGLRQKSLFHALSSARCADGAFLTFDEAGAHLHIVELKSSVTIGRWRHAIEQFSGMYFVASSIAHLLGHSKLASISCYLAMNEDKIDEVAVTSPILLKTLTRGKSTLGEVESWKRDVVPLPFETVRLVKGIRISGDADFGTVA